MTFDLSPLGDRGITIRVGDGISAELSETVVEHAKAIVDAKVRGVTDVVPSYASLGVFYDPLSLSFDDLKGRLENLLVEARPGEAKSDTGRLVTIPVTYSGEDLDDVCRRTSLTKEDLIRIHSGTDYRVLVVGFVPGFAYLGPLDSRLIVPRRESPRKRVPAGSVAIADAQTGVYPADVPGGWNIIGTTTEKMFDASRDEPALLRVGDRVRFVPVG